MEQAVNTNRSRSMSLLVEIEKHLRESAIPPTTFGREAV